MKNCNKVVNTCGGMSPLVCTEYESNVNVDSALININCKNGDEVIQDIYNQLENLNLSSLGQKCLTYVKVGGKNIVKNVLLEQERKICELETMITNSKTTDICNQSIVGCNLNFGTLVDPCGLKPQTLGATLQLILTKLNTP